MISSLNGRNRCYALLRISTRWSRVPMMRYKYFKIKHLFDVRHTARIADNYLLNQRQGGVFAREVARVAQKLQQGCGRRVADSGRKRAHAFCPDCGTQMYATPVGDNPEQHYGLRVGSIRQRAELRPSRQLWCSPRRAQSLLRRMICCAPRSAQCATLIGARICAISGSCHHQLWAASADQQLQMGHPIAVITQPIAFPGFASTIFPAPARQ